MAGEGGPVTTREGNVTGRLKGCGRHIGCGPNYGTCGDVGLCAACFTTRQESDRQLRDVNVSLARKVVHAEARVERLHKAVGDLITAYMTGDDLAPSISALEDLTGGQQHAS